MFALRYLLSCVIAMSIVGSAHAADSSDVSKMLNTDVIQVGAIEAPPWYHQDLITNKWTGIIPDSLDQIFAGQKVKIVYVPTDWGTAVAGLQSGKFVMVGALSQTADRARAVDFTDPLGTIPTGFVTTNPRFLKVKEWSEINQPSVKISAVDGSGTYKGVQDQLGLASLTLVKTSEAMLLELTSGRADLAISNRPTLKDYIAKTQQATLVVPLPVRGTDAPFALRKMENPNFQVWLNARIKVGRADGTLTKIWAKYLNN